MSNDKPPDKRPSSGPAPDTTIVQKVLGKTALALESTMTRLRRIQRTEDVRAGRSPSPSAQPPAPPRAPPPPAMTPAARPAGTAPAARETAPPRPPTQPTQPAGSRQRDPSAAPSGQISHDSRGNAVWKWAANALESTSRMLKRLEAPELSVEDKPKSDGLELEERDPGGGYDPYSKGGRGGGAGYDPYGRGAKQKKP